MFCGVDWDIGLYNVSTILPSTRVSPRGSEDLKLSQRSVESVMSI